MNSRKTTRKYRRVPTLILWSLFFITPIYIQSALFAQSSAQEDKVVYQKRTIIDLRGATIEGELERPEGSFSVVRNVSRFSNLIRTRHHFRPELGNAHNEL